MRTPLRLEEAQTLYSEGEEIRPDEFLALLSHELRTPLGAILAASEVLDSCVPGTADDAEARAVIARQARQLRYALDQLLHIGRSLAQNEDA